METLTADQFKQKYGVIAESSFDQDKRQEGLFSEIKDAFAQGVSKAGQGIEEAQPGNGVGNLVTGVGKVLGGASEAVTAPAAPLLNRTVGKAVGWLGDKLSNTGFMQGYGKDIENAPKTDKTTQPERILGAIGDYANAAGLVGGAMSGAEVAAKVPGTVTETASKVKGAIPKGPDGGTGQAIFNAGSSLKQRLPSAVQDILPTAQGSIDHNLSRALDLTPGDLNTISRSTGNDVGRWMADNDLIGTNKANTLGKIKNFFTDNYNAVRNEIKKVDTIYSSDEVPRFKEVLQVIATETQGKLGLEKVGQEIKGLLAKEEVKLSDVQRVKELLDEHFSLYKLTGDVQAGMQKQGLANVRDQMKTFIENEVKDATGADIRQLNNNVATAKSLASAVETRTPRGLTRSQITPRDAMIGLGLTAFGGPATGLAAVAIWKILSSPSMRLRFARFVDGLSDTQKRQVSDALRTNKLTPEMKKVLELNNQDSMPDIQMGAPSKPPVSTLPSIEY